MSVSLEIYDTQNRLIMNLATYNSRFMCIETFIPTDRVSSANPILTQVKQMTWSLPNGAELIYLPISFNGNITIIPKLTMVDNKLTATWNYYDMIDMYNWIGGSYLPANVTMSIFIRF